jgi:hypothetical protein
MLKPIQLLVLALTLPRFAIAEPITIDFRSLPNDPDNSSNGEVDGTEFIGSGILFRLVNSTAFNVGCGGGGFDTCLSADSGSGFQFDGSIRGIFIDPVTLAQDRASTLSIDFVNDRFSVTTLHDTSGAELSTFLGDFSFSGAVPFAYFDVAFGSGGDGMWELTFTPDAAPVPEPGSLVFTSIALAGLAADRRQRQLTSSRPPRGVPKPVLDIVRRSAGRRNDHAAAVPVGIHEGQTALRLSLLRSDNLFRVRKTGSGHSPQVVSDQ